MARRAVWGLTDQALSSITNFALVIAVARAVSPVQFGGFSAVLAVYLIVGGIGQGIASIPLSVRFSTAKGPAFRSAAREAIGTALSLGIASGGAALLVSLVLPRVVGEPLAALGLTLPGLLLQDALRFVFVAGAQPRRAAANDAIWAAGQLVASGALLHAGNRSSFAWIAAWGFAATLAAVIGCFQLQASPRPLAIVAWLSRQRGLASRYAMESVIVRSSPQLAVLSVGSIAGLSAIGALRGAQFLFSPLNSIYLAALFVAVPEGVRALSSDARRLSRLVNQITVTAIATSAIWSLVVAVLPVWVGREILGATWPSARPLALLVAVQYVLIATTVGAQVGLRSLGAARTSLYAMLGHGVFVIIGATIGGAYGRSYGAAAGLTLGTAAGAIVFWYGFRRAIKSQGRSVLTEKLEPIATIL